MKAFLTTTKIVILGFLAQILSLHSAEFQTSNGGIIKVTQEPGEQMEVAITPPNTDTSFALLMSTDLVTWVKAYDTHSVSSSFYDGSTNTTTLIMKSDVRAQYFDLVADKLTGERILRTHWELGKIFLSGGAYDMQAMFFAEGTLRFSLMMRRSYSSRQLENEMAVRIIENDIPYTTPVILSLGLETNAFLAARADALGGGSE